MQFESRSDGEYTIYAGALEALLGNGFMAAVVVERGEIGRRFEVYRDISISGGHKWITALGALEQAFLLGASAIAKERQHIAWEAAMQSLQTGKSSRAHEHDAASVVRAPDRAPALPAHHPDDLLAS